MFKGLFKGLFSKKASEGDLRKVADAPNPAPAPAPAPAPIVAAVDRAAQAEPVTAMAREWQLLWHDLFDADQTLIDAGEFWRPDPVPAELDRDYRLIFGLSRAEKATRDACFAPMPEGAEMAARFDAYLTSKPIPMPEAEARAILAEIAEMFPGMEPHEEVNFDKVTVIDSNTEEGMAVLRNTDTLTYALEGSRFEAFKAPDAATGAARRLLSEPLYASCGNFFHLRDWVMAPMFNPQWDALQTLLFRLWAGGWQVCINDDGIVLAKRHVGPKAS